MISSVVVLVAGLLVCFGWAADIAILKSIYPNAVSMKFVTAFNFVCLGLAGIAYRKHKPEIATYAYIGVVIMAMFSLFGYVLDLPYSGVDRGVQTVEAGLPSAMTIVAFVLCGVLGAYRSTHVAEPHNAVPVSIILIGVVAVFGHIFAQPFAYYYMPEKSTAMAIHTAVLFVLCGQELLKVNSRIG